MRSLSLAAYLANDKDALLRAQYLELAYENGIRDEEFLVEYAAALGMAQPSTIKFHQLFGI